MPTLLDLPAQPLGREGMISIGTVTHAVDPWEFYIVPQNAWECMCKEDEQAASLGFAALVDFTNRLTDYAEASHQSIPTSLSSNTLIAVKFQTLFPEISTAKCWYRAVVLEEINSDSSTHNIVQAQLIDVGIPISTTIDEIIVLPASFTNSPPFAYKCSLFGISPVFHRWTKSGINTFKFLTQMQPCLFEVKRNPHSESTVTTETVPFQLDLNIKFQGIYYNVAFVLGDYGLGLKWNVTPSRPLVSKHLDGEMWNILCAENEKPGASLHAHASNFDDEVITNRELKRLEKLLGRICIHESSGDCEGLPEELRQNVLTDTLS